MLVINAGHGNFCDQALLGLVMLFSGESFNFGHQRVVVKNVSHVVGGN
jgi:hypothetical protein